MILGNHLVFFHCRLPQPDWQQAPKGKQAQATIESHIGRVEKHSNTEVGTQGPFGRLVPEVRSKANIDRTTNRHSECQGMACATCEVGPTPDYQIPNSLPQGGFARISASSSSTAEPAAAVAGMESAVVGRPAPSLARPARPDPGLVWAARPRQASLRNRPGPAQAWKKTPENNNRLPEKNGKLLRARPQNGPGK